jgi:hypothetical protein
MASAPANLKVCIANDRQPERLRYAAQVLLESAGLDLPIELTESADPQTAGIVLGSEALTTQRELEAVFAALGLERELATGRTDRFGRFDESAIAWDTSTPWIDLLAKRLAARLRRAGCPVVEKPRRFRVFITHDVDRTTAVEPSSLLHTLMHTCRLRRDPWLPLRVTLSPGALVANIDRILQCEVANGIRAYYFMLAGPYGLGRYSSRTSIRWPFAKQFVKLVQDAGMTVGLHGSYRARDCGSYGREKERVEQVTGRPVTAHRNHYLRFDPRQLARQMESAGITHEFSLGFATRMGFRAGTATAHPLFDSVGCRTSAVWSVPLLSMDNVLFQLGRERAMLELRGLLQEAKRAGGCVSLLFHPELFIMYEWAMDMFLEIIGVCRELDADLAGPLPGTEA